VAPAGQRKTSLLTTAPGRPSPRHPLDGDRGDNLASRLAIDDSLLGLPLVPHQPVSASARAARPPWWALFCSLALSGGADRSNYRRHDISAFVNLGRADDLLVSGAFASLIASGAKPYRSGDADQRA